jgi:hypothetical protein
MIERDFFAMQIPTVPRAQSFGHDQTTTPDIVCLQLVQRIRFTQLSRISAFILIGPGTTRSVFSRPGLISEREFIHRFKFNAPIPTHFKSWQVLLLKQSVKGRGMDAQIAGNFLYC